jgi:putative CocE/NonD family hydrolase
MPSLKRQIIGPGSLCVIRVRNGACALALILAGGAAQPGLGASGPACNAPAAPKVSRPFEYGGYDCRVFDGYHRVSAYAPVRDGTKLAITVYLPNGGAGERFPTILWYLPGHRESIDPKTGKITSTYRPDQIAFYTSHGYAVAAAEMRGSGASFGAREIDRTPQIGRDGKDLVDWIAAQPWSSGSVGMVGSSYQGFSQYATAAQRPKALKAIFPEIAGFDDYTSMFHPGGVMVQALAAYASDRIATDDRNDYVPAGGATPPNNPSVPVVDEDGDGDLLDEIPLDKNGNGSFLDDGPPTYSDGKPRQDIYFKATQEHLRNNYVLPPTLAAAPYRDSKLGGTNYAYRDIDPSARPAEIAASGIAVYNRGGWYDYHARDTAYWFATLQGHTPARLMMAPTAHNGFPVDGRGGGPYFAHLGDTTTVGASMDREKLRFFDRYLKGVDNGFEREPPVMIYVMGKGWRAEATWPLKREVRTPFYLDDGGGLGRGAPKAGTDAYKVDYTADSRSGGANRWNYGITGATTELRFTESDAKRLSYTSTPLAADMEVTGHPVVHLAISSSAPEGDVFAYLEEVDEAGVARQVADGVLRANFNRLKPNDDMLAVATIKAKPALPWHGFRQADYQAAPLAGGRTVELTFDLMPTSWVFRKGRRIRVSIAGADHPSFRIHPALSANDDPATATPVTLTVHRGAGSYIDLPVIPAGR